MCRTCIYVTEPTREMFGILYVQFSTNAKKKNTAHVLMSFCQVAGVEIRFKKINHNCFKLAGKLESGHDTGLILTTILFFTSLNFHIDQSLGTTKGKEKMNSLLDEYQSY